MHINRELERLTAMTRDTENELRKLQSKQEYFVINYQDSIRIQCKSLACFCRLLTYTEWGKYRGVFSLALPNASTDLYPYIVCS